MHLLAATPSTLCAIMKIAYLIILMLGCKFSFAQKWTKLGNTSIEHISIVDHTDTIVFFKKDSAAIAVPITMLKDFQQLFLQDQHSFDMINDSCLHFQTFMMGDSVESMLNIYGIKQVVYFIKREIKKTRDEETWALTNVYSQGQPCWPAIVIRRSKNKAAPMKFLSVIRGFCEI
jgi:hypothetical protein